ncbi:MAG: radical SAM protein, partial [bacterium]
LFFRNSGGGVTLSGGEPLLQHEFVHDFLHECRRIGLSVGMESCGWFEWEAVEPFIRSFDFFYFDIKCMDSTLHRKFVGVDNGKILANLDRLAKIAASKITVTIPVIPGFNDTPENTSLTARYCRRLGVAGIRLLAYHSLGAGKYEELGRDYAMNDKAALPAGWLEELKEIVIDEGLICSSS